MAQIIKRVNKKGEVSYGIRVSNGYDGLGKQIIHQMTWHPDPSMSARQAEREALKQSIQFEEKITQIEKHAERQEQYYNRNPRTRGGDYER